MATYKTIFQLAESDLQQLISDSVMEGKRIEYKQSLDIEKDESKRKFLASIASFANASGGDIFFGIRAVDGKPIGIISLEEFNPDAIKLRLTQLIRDGIEPKIVGIDFHEIPLTSGGFAFAIRIPKTFSGAHMVVYNNDNRFYSRAANGRVSMDVTEVRAAFILSETTTEKIAKWRVKRVADILADETPIQLNFPGRTVIHLIPFRAFDPLFRADLSELWRDKTNLLPLGFDECSTSYDFDGVFGSFNDLDEKSYGYSFAMANGCIEIVDASLLGPFGQDTRKLIRSNGFEAAIIDHLPVALKLYRQIGCEPPFFLSISLLNVKDYKLGVSNQAFPNNKAHAITRDCLYLPDIFVDSFEVDAARLLHDSFNLIWRACGWPQSHSYDKEGNWKRLS